MTDQIPHPEGELRQKQGLDFGSIREIELAFRRVVIGGNAIPRMGGYQHAE